MDKTEYQAVVARFRNVLESSATLLSRESQENVYHFIEASEAEMACESFVLSVLEEAVLLPGDVKKELLNLSLRLNLDKESVFRADFWKIAGPFLRGDAHAQEQR